MNILDEINARPVGEPAIPGRHWVGWHDLVKVPCLPLLLGGGKVGAALRPPAQYRPAGRPSW